MTLDSTADKAKTFAANVVKAAGRYADTDGDLGNRFGQQQFGPNGGQGQPGNGGPRGGGPGGGGMGEMMQMPMQMAGQALQAPMQMVGMIGSLPQTLMQGMQSLGGMAGLGGHGGQQDKGDAKSIDLPADSQQDKDKQDKPEDQQDKHDDKQDELRHQAAGPQRERLQPTPDVLGPGAAGGQSNGSAAPVAPPAPIRPVAPRSAVDL